MELRDGRAETELCFSASHVYTACSLDSIMRAVDFGVWVVATSLRFRAWWMLELMWGLGFIKLSTV